MSSSGTQQLGTLSNKQLKDALSHHLQIMASKPGYEIFLAKHAQQLLQSSAMRKTAQTHHVSLEARCTHCEGFCEPELHYLELNLDAPASEKFEQVARGLKGDFGDDTRDTRLKAEKVMHGLELCTHVCQQCFQQRRFLPQPEQQRIADGRPLPAAEGEGGGRLSVLLAKPLVAHADWLMMRRLIFEILDSRLWQQQSTALSLRLRASEFHPLAVCTSCSGTLDLGFSAELTAASAKPRSPDICKPA